MLDEILREDSKQKDYGDFLCQFCIKNKCCEECPKQSTCKKSQKYKIIEGDKDVH